MIQLSNQLNYLVHHKSLIPPFSTYFQLHNNICEFSTCRAHTNSNGLKYYIRLRFGIVNSINALLMLKTPPPPFTKHKLLALKMNINNIHLTKSESKIYIIFFLKASSILIFDSYS